MGKVDKSRMKRSKHKDRKVADFGSVIARNEEAWKNKKDSDEEDESSEEEEKEEEEDNPNVYKKEKTVNSAMLAFQQMHLDAEKGGAVPQEKAAPTRREREAMQKEAARKRYEKMHAEGKTDEAKADLERLAKIRAEREAAKKAREAEQEKAGAGKVDLRAEYTAALRGEDGGRKPGKKDKKEKKEKKEKEDEPAPSTTAASSNVDDSEAPTTASKACQRHNEGLYEGYTSGIAKPETVERSDLVAGSIEACRAEEEDFM